MSADSLSPRARQSQRLLRIYHLYRLTIGLALVLLISSNMDSELLVVADDGLFQIGSWLYLILNILVVVLLDTPASPPKVLSLTLADTLMLCGLFYAAGGIPSGIGQLLITSVAISNVLLRWRIGFLIAAISAIGIIYLTFYLSFNHPEQDTYYVQAGALGALCFAASLLVQALTRLLDHSDSLAEQRADDISNLEELNALILRRIRTGILVIDAQRRVLLANSYALNLFGATHLSGQLIDDCSPSLVDRLQRWANNPTLRPQSLQITIDGPVVQPGFTYLRHGEYRQTLVFLEDLAHITQQAQQLKLAALGRLTAGIAHEIRNPLGAISHAAQLLQESEVLETADRRLTQIIQDQSKRMNLVIENVLQLSRRRRTAPKPLALKPWLENFVCEFRSRLRPDQHLHLTIDEGVFETRMDAEQLVQVLTNLLQNALRYSAQGHQQADVWLHLFIEPNNQLPILEVLDNGPGVADEQLQHLFEPFFTTHGQGTGLGLYLSRELCESNQARLDYKPQAGGSCFRITFAHPLKQR